MIKTENISKAHYINNTKPDYFITLPFIKGEQINEEDVTCFFCVEFLPNSLKCVGIDFFEEVNNETLEAYTYGQYRPTHIYIFKNVKFDLDKERGRLIID